MEQDEPANQFVMRTLLQRVGHQLDIANDGQEAVEMYSRERGRYDAVLLDMVRLPWMEMAAVKRLASVPFLTRHIAEYASDGWCGDG